MGPKNGNIRYLREPRTSPDFLSEFSWNCTFPMPRGVGGHFALYRPKSDLSYLLQKHNYLVFHRHQFYISIIFLSWMNFCHVIALEGDISINKTICEWKAKVFYVTISLLFYFQISLINIWHHICCIVVGGPGVARICVGRIFELIIIYFFKNDFSYNN